MKFADIFMCLVTLTTLVFLCYWCLVLIVILTGVIL